MTQLAGVALMSHDAPSVRERLRAQLADLKMPGALEALDAILTARRWRHAPGAGRDRGAARGADRAPQ